ncbi:carbonic anhydrase [Synechococcales cyanobacterium C]|uniref:Carbonic anhydrase n=1 Tax=Petrachloros mirabilis ULC683 TaxID=2781853 RepID=A0A8K2A7A6_9CYAN|nr:carbonic anhydrase [Petrachloros mirabilis ULC683]
MNRRNLLKLGSLGLVASASPFLGLMQRAEAAEAVTTAPPSLSPDAALEKLMAGNQRFVGHKLQHPDQSEARLHEVAQAQHPFATVLCCADSRVPVEILFDQGVGDIFDVRVAGNIATPAVVGSVEYAVALLGTPVLMVLGHERCGAVTAAVQNQPLPGDIGTFVEAILPAVERVKDQPGDLVENAVLANVTYQIEQLQKSPLLAERLESGQLKVVGGRYDLDTGKVTLLT